MSVFQGRVLVLGANGETGKQVVQSLQKQYISTRAMVRSAEKAERLASATTEVFVGNVLNQADLTRAITGVTAVISALGTRSISNLQIIEDAEYTAIINVIDAALEADIEQIVLCSSMGTDTPERVPPLINILRAKRRAEEALIQSGIAYTIVHPGGLTNIPGGLGVLIQPHPATSMGSITREDVGEVLVQALLQPGARNRSVDVINQEGQPLADSPDLFS